MVHASTAGMNARRADFAAQRLEESVTGMSYTTEDHHDVRVEDVEEVGDANAKIPSRVVGHLPGHRIAGIGRLVDQLRGHPVEIAAGEVPHRARAVRCQQFPRAAGDVLSGSERLEAAVIAAAAERSVGVDHHVAEFAGHVGRAMVEPAVDHDAAADTGAEREADDLPAALRRADPALGLHRAIRVILQRRGDAEAGGEPGAKRQVGPAEVGGQQDDTLGDVERTRCADTDADNIRLRVGGGDRVADPIAPSSPGRR